jgi:hypothetical protein
MNSAIQAKLLSGFSWTRVRVRVASVTFRDAMPSRSACVGVVVFWAAGFSSGLLAGCHFAILFGSPGRSGRRPCLTGCYDS